MLILCKRCAEICLNILFQRIQHLFMDFQRNQHKPFIISAHSADFLQNYSLTAADPSTRAHYFQLILPSVRTYASSTARVRVWIDLTILFFNFSIPFQVSINYSQEQLFCLSHHNDFVHNCIKLVATYGPFPFKGRKYAVFQILGNALPAKRSLTSESHIKPCERMLN